MIKAVILECEHCGRAIHSEWGEYSHNDTKHGPCDQAAWEAWLSAPSPKPDPDMITWAMPIVINIGRDLNQECRICAAGEYLVHTPDYVTREERWVSDWQPIKEDQ